MCGFKHTKVINLGWDILANPSVNNYASYRLFNEIKVDKTSPFVFSIHWDRELGVSLCYRGRLPWGQCTAGELQALTHAAQSRLVCGGVYMCGRVFQLRRDAPGTKPSKFIQFVFFFSFFLFSFFSAP